MNRRELIKYLTMASACSFCGCSGFSFRSRSESKVTAPAAVLPPKSEQAVQDDIGEVSAAPSSKKLTSQEVTGDFIKDLKARSTHFDQTFPDDIQFAGQKFDLLKSTLAKLRGVQSHVGFGNFNIMGMDEFFATAKKSSRAGELTKLEKSFIEELFYFDAKKYGFQGDKVTTGFTDLIKKNSVQKVAGSGHYLAKGRSLQTYSKIKKDVGDSIILTSGIRGLAKQYHLFLEKGLETKGNMSKASRSLAPPGYSFHGLADFDIGKRGGGIHNFTDDFALTTEYRKLIDLGYVEVRYPESNLLGVRFEPWHVKIS